MTLLEIRQNFIKRSGRADFAETETEENDVDKGADFFINGALRDLDLEQDNAETTSSFVRALAADGYTVDMMHNRSITKVYFTDSDGAEVELEKKSFEWTLKNYPKLGSETSGTPSYWSNYPTKRAPEQVGAGSHYTMKSILIMAPTDLATTITVFGRFWSEQLKLNHDENHWSVHYPQLLILAACRNLEGWYRNTQGYNDWDKLVEKQLLNIDKDLVEQNIVDNDSMRG